MALVLFLAGCGPETHESDTRADPGHEPHRHDHETSEGSLSASAMNAYITIQEALAADSLEGIEAAARDLTPPLEALGETGAAEAMNAITHSGDMEEIRRHFETVSNAVLARLQEHGAESGEFFEAHCPMAFGNRGASWVQADTTVNNPYFGARMLRCGEIRQTFTAANGHHDHPTAPGVDELPEGARTFEIEGHEFHFDPEEIVVAPGEVFALKLVNKGVVVHMWEIEGRPETHVHAEVGETAIGVITAPEEPGEYRTVCTEPGHIEGGMVGRLIVTPDADSHGDSHDHGDDHGDGEGPEQGHQH